VPKPRPQDNRLRFHVDRTWAATGIVASTEAHLEAHLYADPARLGCIGANYGGFMTMLLTTRTDMFGAAVSHSGISSISSCRGEGNLGFASSAEATAKSYPWNRLDIYIDESPLFAADKAVTPLLLLLHGAVDHNVPPGEREQMYTALRVLGKEVEYIRIDDELHWLLQYDRHWSESIVARFDKHLKDDAACWRHLWPEDE
jgi:dipeptidyl aminopeptidase/acylaminoacyl peptidase